MSARDLRRAGLLPDPFGWGLVLLAALTCWGCMPGPRTRGGQLGDQAPHVGMVTTSGVSVSYPVWLQGYPDHLAAMLDEIATVTPDADPRISPAHRGVPAGATVIVLDPGSYYQPGSHTSLATGEWHPPLEIVVAWRGTPQGVRLPALPHELRHLLTQDPRAGH